MLHRRQADAKGVIQNLVQSAEKLVFSDEHDLMHVARPEQADDKNAKNLPVYQQSSTLDVKTKRVSTMTAQVEMDVIKPQRRVTDNAVEKPESKAERRSAQQGTRTKEASKLGEGKA